MSTLTIQNEPVYYVGRRGGAAGRPPLVLIHGAGGSHQHWLYVIRELAGVRTIAPDLPGHGRSAGAGRDTVAAYVDWLIALLDGLRLERAIVAGHSLGGAMALDAALRYPERIAALGLVAAGARMRVAPAILGGLRDDLQPTIRLICEWCYGPHAPPGTVEMGEAQMALTPPEVLRGDFAAANAFDAMGRLAEIAAPVAVVTGSEDRMTPPKYAAFLCQHLPRSTLHLVDGAGHMVMIERPDAVAAALRSLLEG